LKTFTQHKGNRKETLIASTRVVERTEMFERKTLFIGCGDGKELLPLVHDRENLLIGLEPSDQLFSNASDSLKEFPNVLLLHGRIQDWKTNKYAGSIEQIYFIFPLPEILRSQAEVIVSKIHSLLSKDNGIFQLYTEITFSGWCDPEDREKLKAFLKVLSAWNFSVSTTEICFDEMPPMARVSHCGLLFKTHNFTRFTKVEAKKL